jgi:tetratricopeptide (TPR) repeat protein
MRFGIRRRVRNSWPLLAGLIAFLAVCVQAGAAAGQSSQADQSYQQGVQSLRQEQWKAAVSSFEEALKLDPRRADAENGLGAALGKLGDQSGSQAAFRRAIEIDPGYAEAHYNLALWLREAGDLGQALSELSTAIKLRPDYEAAQLASGLIFQQVGDPDKAVELFKAVLQQDPRSSETHNWLGVVYAQKNHLLDSIGEFQQAIDINPEYLDAYNNLAATLIRAKRFEEAGRVSRSGLTLSPHNVELRLNLSRAIRAKGSLDAALTELRLVLKDGDNAEVEYEIAEILRQKGDFKGSIEASENALALRPGMGNAYESLGLALQAESAARVPQPNQSQHHALGGEAKDRYDSGRELLSKREMDAAKNEFEKAIEEDPKGAEAHNLLGFVLGQLGDLPRAIEHLHKAVALDPALATAHYNLGVALWYSHQTSESIPELRTAIRLDPAFAEAYSFLGMAFGQSGELDNGRRYLERAISLNPDLPGPHIDLGLTLLKTGQSEAAFEQFQSIVNRESAEQIPDLQLAVDAVQESIKQKADDALAYDTLGLLLGKAGSDPQAVREQFRKAIQLRPNLAEAHNHLGLALIQTGGDDAAIKEFREALRLNPNYAEAHGNLGAAVTSNNDEEAIRELELAISLQPDSVKAQYNLAMAYLQKYGVDKEIDQLQNVIRLDPNFSEAYYSLGKALMQKGRIQEALAPLQRAVSLDPNSGHAHYQLGLALSRTNQTEEGKLELDKGLKLIADDERNRKANALEAQAKLELEKGQTQPAAEDFKAVVQLLPDYAEGHLMLAEALAKLSDLEGSIREFQRTLELQPNLYAADIGLGQVLKKKGNLADAQVAFEAAIRLRPSSAEAYNNLGLVLTEEGDQKGAAAAFRKVLEIEPGNVAGRENLDAILNKTASTPATSVNSAKPVSSLPSRPSVGELIPNGDVDDVGQIKNFEAAIDQDKIDEVEPLVLAYLKEHPNSWRAHYIQGYVLFRMRKIGDSIKELAKSLELNVDNPEAHKILGRDFVVIGKFDYAQTELQQAARLKPQSAEIHYSLGEVYSGRDMFKEAKSEFATTIQLDSKYAEAYNALGFADESLGDDTAALEAYNKALQVADQKGFKFDAPYINLSAYYNRLGKPELALQKAQKAIELDSKSDLAYYQLGRAYQSLSKWDQAAEAFRNAVSANPVSPSSAQYYYVLSQVYRKLGKTKESLAALERFQELKHATELIEDKMLDNRRVSVSKPAADDKQ